MAKKTEHTHGYGCGFPRTDGEACCDDGPLCPWAEANVAEHTRDYHGRVVGPCLECGTSDDWHVDGRGNTLCGCQACSDCGIVDAYGFHETGCPRIDDDTTDDDENDEGSVDRG